jgi:hypothetical protein
MIKWKDCIKTVVGLNRPAAAPTTAGKEEKGSVVAAGIVEMFPFLRVLKWGGGLGQATPEFVRVLVF